MHGEQARELHAALLRENGDCLKLIAPASIIAELDAIPDDAPYHVLPQAEHTHWQRMRAHPESRLLEVVLRAVLLELIIDFEQRAAHRRYTPAVIECFERSYARILTELAAPDHEPYAALTDVALKDLALCRQHLFPAGAQVVDPNASFNRSLLYSGGMTQALAFTRLMLHTGGNTHYYQIHTHLSEMEDFNPDGWDRCYVRLAGMLRANPRIRGMVGGSWFYDPALETVSPRLVYLRKVPQGNGAGVFRVRLDTGGDALAKSESRRQLYEQGKYTPTAYAIIWPREPLLAWADKVARV